ncbi:MULTISPECIES: hypothetical protein [unclassified Nocardioides]|uniref:hypothetical protein n=1 Tax=unclassified Nocardioides TaxID=2615069 RepID=UPI00301584A5
MTMQLSKLGQGLAISAVSALAITGLAVTAPPALAADGPGVRLLSQYDAVASTRSDGAADGTIALTAEKVDQQAAVTFEYNADPAAGDLDPGWVQVTGTATSESGYETLLWAPAPEQVDKVIALRAVATTETAGGPTVTYSTRNSVELSGPGSGVNSVGLQTGSSSTTDANFFAPPYTTSTPLPTTLRIDGTTSANDGAVELSVWHSADGAFRGQIAAAVEATPVKIPGTGNQIFPGGEFDGVLDITAFDAEAGDTLAVRAERDSDDVKPVVLRAQTISQVFLASVFSTSSQATTFTLAVGDQDEDRIAGAEVRRSSDGSLVGYTDAAGEVTVTQPNSSAATYYANSTDVDAFEEGVDVVSAPVETPAYEPVATSTRAVLADGPVFDVREYAAGDIALQVLDQEGSPMAAAEELEYRLFRTGQEPPALAQGSTDANGRLVVPFDPSGTDGEYTLAFTTPASAGGQPVEPVTFVAGDAVLGLTPVKGRAASGAEIRYAGTLSVEGEPLARRTVDLGYTRGTELVPGAQADAALLLDGARRLSGAVTTDTDGTFAVTVDDLAERGRPTETGGQLRVAARGLADRVDATADFGSGKGTAKLRLAGSGNGARADRLRISGPPSVAGERVRVFARSSGGSWRPVKTLRLNDDGDTSLSVRDRNGSQVTRYYVKLLSSLRVTASKSNARRLR